MNQVGQTDVSNPLGQLWTWSRPPLNPRVRPTKLTERHSLGIVNLGQIVHDFARAMEAVDHRRPQAASHRDATRLYQPGIGPFGEDVAVAMTVAEMQTADPSTYADVGKRRYPGSSTVCDLVFGAAPDWAIEVKLARLGRDNGTYEDAAIKKILSPYSDDRSAVTDCRKLAGSGFAGKRAILIYGFEDPDRPLAWLIEAFEAVAAKIVSLGPREEAPLNHLVHPVFAAGRVYAWEVLAAKMTAPGPNDQPIGLTATTNHGEIEPPELGRCEN